MNHILNAMMRLMRFTTLALLVTTSCAVHNEYVIQQKSNVNAGAEIAKSLYDKVVALRSASNLQNVYCTATWVSKTEILTAGHCVIDSKNKDELVFYTTEHSYVSNDNLPIDVYRSKVIAINASYDLALLQSVDSMPLHGYMKLARTTPDVGADVFMLGHPNAILWTFVKGNVAAYRESKFVAEHDILGPWIQLNMSSTRGTSGSVIVDSNGTIVGVMSFISPAVPNSAWAVHLETIRQFLRKTTEN